VPVTALRRFDQYVSKSLPIGMTAPRPVTTARRERSDEGTVHLSDLDPGTEVARDCSEGVVVDRARATRAAG
jgi:hypothetical protein